MMASENETTDLPIIPPEWADACPSWFAPKPVRRQIGSSGRQTHPRSHEPDDVRAWIDKLCRSLSITPSRLASVSGIAASTLNRLLNKTGNVKNLSGLTIFAIEQAVSELSNKNDDMEIKYLEKRRIIVDVQVIGKIGIDLFVWDKAHSYTTKTPIDAVDSNYGLVGFKISGRHLDKIPDGSILFCKTLLTGSVPTSPELTYIAMIRQSDGFVLVVCQFLLDPIGYAWMVNLMNRHEPPILVKYPEENRTSTKTVFVIGVVKYAFVPIQDLI